MSAEAKSEEGRKAFIEVKGLKKQLGSQKVLRGMDLKVHEGETLVLIGPSGEGKSVFLKHLLGLMKPDAGSIVIEGEDVASLRERQWGPVRKKIGMLFQNGALFDSMNVAQNVAFPLREAGVKDQDEIEDRVREALRVVELEAHGEKMPVNLSGGMRKRVALARAIVSRPKCILYDEPTAGLDPVVADSIDHLIKRLQEQLGVTSIVVTHDMKSMFGIADRIAYFREGKIYFRGTPEEFRRSEDPLVRFFVEGNSDDFHEHLS